VQRKYKNYDIDSSHLQSNIYHFVLQTASFHGIKYGKSQGKLMQFILLFIINDVVHPNDSSNYPPHSPHSFTTDSFRKARSLERC